MDPKHFLRERPIRVFPVQHPRRYFHATWYSDTYLSHSGSEVDPWQHYVLVGERSGALPNPLFCPAYYRAQAGEHGGLALGHYARFGIERMIHPHPLVRPAEPGQDLDWFAENDDPHTAHLVRPVASPAQGSTLLHYLLANDAEWRHPNPLFDRAWYRKHVGAEIEKFGDPLAHYLATGGHRGLPTARDITWKPFLDRRPDLLLQTRTPMEHALLHEAPGSYTFGDLRPEALITQALAENDIDQALALIAAWYLDKPDSWASIKLKETPPTGDLEVRELAGGLLLRNGVMGTLLGEPTAVHVPASWWAAGHNILLREPPSATITRIDRCVILDPTRISSPFSVQSAVIAAVSAGIPLVTSAEVADALRLFAHRYELTLDLREPGDGIAADDVVINPTDQMLHEMMAPTEFRVSLRSRNAPRSGTRLSELTSRGLLAFLGVLPSGSKVTVANSLCLSPAAARTAIASAQRRSIQFELLRNRGRE